MKKKEREILEPFALDIAKQISGKCISYLKELTVTLSGDDSELKNVWEEICVQVQHEHSLYWDAYDETVRSFVRGHVAELQYYQQKALWYQSDAYWDWYIDEQEVADDLPPVADDDIVTYITNNFIYRKAEEYTNSNIESFSERNFFN